MAGTRHSDQIRHGVQIFADYGFIASDYDVGQAISQLQQLLSPRGVARNIDNGELYLVIRKKLFRLEAAASPGLGEEEDLVSSGTHGGTPVILDAQQE